MTAARALSALVGASVLGACEPAPEPVALTVEARLGGEVARCGAPLLAAGATAADVDLLDLRFFLSDPVLSGPDGETPLHLTADDTWQTERVALLDLEDGSGACGASGNAETNDRLLGEAVPGDFDTLTFQLGLPFDLNHQDAVSQPAPLNNPGMFWAWQAGHKFARIDVRNPAGDGWNLHLGSTDCRSDGATIAPSVACDRPNLASISVPYTPDGTLVLDLGALWEGADLTANAPESPPGCMSSPMDGDECTPIYASLGLSFETGACVDGCADQRVFLSE